jgi:hypothetical protein
MTSETEAFERTVLNSVRAIVDDSKSNLEKVGIVADSPSLSIDIVEQPVRTSEVAICFRAGGDVVDMIEFHVYRGGVRLASASEIESWLREAIADVVRRREQ